MQKSIKTECKSNIIVSCYIKNNLEVSCEVECHAKNCCPLEIFGPNGEIHNKGESKHFISRRSFDTVSRTAIWLKVVFNEVKKYEIAYETIEKELKAMIDGL